MPDDLTPDDLTPDVLTPDGPPPDGPPPDGLTSDGLTSDGLTSDILAPMPEALLLPGQLLARGVARHLLGHDFVSVLELVPGPGLRVDVMALGPRGEVWIVECKSSRNDYVSDRKWHGYLEWCDRFFWAVDADFPTDLLPEDTGLILADSYDAEIVRMGPEQAMAGARRKALLVKFARHAALRLHGLRDPRAGR